MTEFDVDVLVVGSGFGGSVSALRLREKGYRVLVLEAGRRYRDQDFPRTNWNLSKFLWAPRFGLKGLQRIHFLRDVMLLAASGVGGGSLIYANTLYVPPQEFFEDRAWQHITDWRAELSPYYDQSQRMLGVVRSPTMTAADEVMKGVADELGVGDTFTMTPVGVHFGSGPSEEVADPFFGGQGPARSGCKECGGCMTGCRHNAKNTLPKNYLGLAEAAGAHVIPLTTVTDVMPLASGGYQVTSERTGMLPGRGRRRTTARHVIFSAGAYNTQVLLHRMKERGSLPDLSPSLGRLSRSNSESLLAVVGPADSPDYSRGVAITSSFHTRDGTHIEPVRYARNSNAMSLLNTVLTDEQEGEARWRTWLRQVRSDPGQLLAIMASIPHASERTIIALAMQAVDNSLVVRGTRGRLGRWKLTSEPGEGAPNPTWLPAANDAVRRMAARMDGIPGGNVGDVAGRTMTAHFVGGATISDHPDGGVVDPYQRVWNYDGLHVIDGAAITANLGVNPSLTITAQAERACAMWPNRGEPDPRPAQSQAYRPVAPVPPRHPVVPERAPGGLRLPIVDIRTGPDAVRRPSGSSRQGSSARQE